VKVYLIVCCVAGIVIPYWFAIPFFLMHGMDIRLFAAEIFATRISSFFAADLIIASVIFLSWSRRDAGENKIGGWWMVLFANLLVGLSFALPLYLLKGWSKARSNFRTTYLRAAG
jgi:riboflavin transporter FmnP